MKLHFMAFSQAKFVQDALSELQLAYGQHDICDADAVVAVGGDGSILRAIHSIIGKNIPIFSMNRGSYGFLTNPYMTEGLEQRIKDAVSVTISPLVAYLTFLDGSIVQEYAVNEVYFMRSTHQAAKLKISVDSVVRMHELAGDGLIIATTVGSTAYNYSADGPILPLNSDVMAITAISAFRPRHWRGAVIKSSSVIEVGVLEISKRPVSVVADYLEYTGVVGATVSLDKTVEIQMLFDKSATLYEKTLQQQFAC